MSNSMENIVSNLRSLDDINVIIKKYKDNRDALHGLGRALMKRQRFDMAFLAFDRLSEIAPNDPQAHTALGMSLVMTDRTKEAVRHFEKAVSIEPNSSLYHANLGKAYLMLQRWGDAKESINNALISCDNIQKRVELDELLQKAEIELSNNAKNDFTVGSENLNIIQTKSLEENSTFGIIQATVNENTNSTLQGIMCCLQGLDNFVDEIISMLKPNINFNKVVSNEIDDHIKAIENEELVWLEWGNQLAQILTNKAADKLKNKRVILRIHSYEVLDRLADKINYSVINDLIFVAPHIKEIFIKRNPEIVKQVKRIHVIPNGVDVNKIKLEKKKKGFNIAFLAQLNFKKDPMVAMHAFREIFKKDMRYTLHIGGNIQEDRYSIAINNFINKNNMNSSIVFNGWIKNVQEWLKDKHYIICSSLMEGHPVGLMEAMARGCCPLIYNFPGAENLYPSNYLWAELDDIWEMLQRSYSPEEYRSFIKENYSLEAQSKSIAKMINEKYIIKEKNPETVSADIVIPDNLFGKQSSARADSLIEQAKLLYNNNEVYLANEFAARALSVSNYSFPEGMNLLVNMATNEKDMWSFKDVFYKKAISDFAENSYDNMLKNFYTSIYAEKMCDRRDQGLNYDTFSVKNEIHAFIQAASEKIQSNKNVEKIHIIKDGKKRKINIGFIVETLDAKQAPIKYILEIIKNINADKINTNLYCRYPINSAIGKQQNYFKTIEQMKPYVKSVVCPFQNDNWLRNVEEIEKALIDNETDIAIFSTSYYSTPLNLLSRLKPAKLIGAFEFQGPEYNEKLDFVLSGTQKGIIDAKCDAYLLPQQVVLPEYNRKYMRKEVNIPEDAIVLATVAREIRYNSPVFWKNICDILNEHPNVWYLPIGMNKPKRSIDRVVYPGFVDDAPNMLSIADIYVDLFPSGTGLSVAEAMTIGLPTVCFSPNYLTSFKWHKETFGSEWTLPELIVKYGDYATWKKVIKKLIQDVDYRRNLGMKALNKSKKIFSTHGAAQCIEQIIEEQFQKILCN